MYSFFIQSYSTYKGLFRWLNWPGYISGTIVQPFATVLMFSILGRFTSSPELARAYALGIAVSSMAFIVMSGMTQSYLYDRTFGTLSFLYVSPANRLVNFIARSTFHYPNALISFSFGLLAARVIVDLNFGSVNWSAFIVSVLVIAFSITAFGQLLGVITIVVRDWIEVQNMATGILLIFCGAIIPIEIFPEIIQGFARILPITNGLNAVKESFIGAQFSIVQGKILQEAVIGLVYYMIAFVGFMQFERLVKRTGTLERDSQ